MDAWHDGPPARPIPSTEKRVGSGYDESDDAAAASTSRRATRMSGVHRVTCQLGPAQHRLVPRWTSERVPML